MAYTNPQVIAQNTSAGSYAAGCPAKDQWPDKNSQTGKAKCAACERTV